VSSIYPIQTEVFYSEAGVKALGFAYLSLCKDFTKLQLPTNTCGK
jgi:hypothetical protein